MSIRYSNTNIKKSKVSPEEPFYWNRRSFRRVGIGILALLFVIVVGTIGYVLVGWDFSDALYMVAITISTVGFTEVRPLQSGPERLHTMFVIGAGTISVAYVVGSIISLITEGELKQLLGHQNLKRRVQMLKDHQIIVGFGRMGSLICDELAKRTHNFVVIERDAELLEEIARRGYPFVRGDATEELVLAEAGLERANALVTAVATDAESVFITLTARQMAPDLTIIARAELPSSEKKLRQAGANHVVLTAAIGARRIASLLHSPNTVEFVELVTKQTELDLELQEIPITEGDMLSGRNLRDADIGRKTGGLMVIAIKRRSGKVEFPPEADRSFENGDRIIILGRHDQLRQFATIYCPTQSEEEDT